MDSLATIEKFMFKLYIFGFRYYIISFEDDIIQHYSGSGFYYKNSELHQHQIAPGTFQQFISNLNKHKILQWKDEYLNHFALVDGEDWEFEICYNNSMKKKIKGSNSYPGGQRQNAGRTIKFNKFLKELSNLIEDPTFFKT